jgi:hypothetical protein
MELGQIERPTTGSSYILQIDAALLRQALLVLAAVVVRIDPEQCARAGYVSAERLPRPRLSAGHFSLRPFRALAVTMCCTACASSSAS